ncbi:MAG: putative lipid II flippase FtsW [Thermodesulfovibrionales bacterium]
MASGRIDRTILFITLSLSMIGILMVYSSTSVSPETGTQSYYYLKKHLLTFLMGILLLLFFTNIELRVIRAMAIPLLIFSFSLLMLVFTGLGISAGGARRWLRLWPTAFQPSELAKFSMVLFLSWYMSRERYLPDSWKEMIIPVVVMGCFQVIFIRQPDFGAFMTFGILTLSMIFLSGMRLKYIASLGVILIPVIYYLIKEPYRWKRIVAFLDPWSDPTGSGFQLIQSLIAFGSGGLIGVGLGESKQKLLYLPAIHNDFIFALVGEELGLIGAYIVVLLFLWLFLRGVSIAKKTKDPFSYYLASGISLMIAIEAVVNFSVATGLAPTKGLPLPFISYGGSSLVVNMIAIGLLLNISRNSEYILRDGVKKMELIIEKKKAYVRKLRGLSS